MKFEYQIKGEKPEIDNSITSIMAIDYKWRIMFFSDNHMKYMIENEFLKKFEDTGSFFQIAPLLSWSLKA